jgi:hypothetical protein
MDNPHGLRSKGWAGLAFVVLAIVSVALSGARTPEANAGTAAIAAYLDAHRHGLLVAGWLSFPTVAFFLWFVVGVSSYLRRMSAQDEGLPTYAFTSGIFTSAVAFIGGLLGTALVFAPVVDKSDLQFLWALTSLANGTFVAMGVAIFAFAVAHSMRRHNSGPQWLVWLGYITALGEAVVSFGMFYPSDIVLGAPIVGLLLGFILFAVWMVGVSAILILEGSKQLAGLPA